MNKKDNRKMILGAGMLMLSTVFTPASAQVSMDEAARLGKDLTPFGAETSGNATGIIPEWKGGITAPPASWQAPDGHRPDPFADDQAVFTISSDNVAQYQDNLTPGQLALFKAFPQTYKMNVYPTRRSHAAPDWVYENTKKNAEKATLTDGGNGIDGAYGGIPFPIPQNGIEVIWNHLARFQSPYMNFPTLEALVQPNGSSSRWEANVDFLFPYYQKDGDIESSGGQLLAYASNTLKPARDAGEGTLALDFLNAAQKPRKAWIYDPGERRVRRAPTLGFDSPDRAVNTYDDFLMYNGSPERYDFKLLGKKEIYIPYNSYKVTLPELKYDEVLKPNHMNPEHLRYELHRVWVVEATVKEGQRHLYAKRVFYIDEDSWAVATTDKYDGKGSLWRTSTAYLKNFYDVPMTLGAVFSHTDLKNGTYYVWGLTNEFKGSYNFSKEQPKKSFYTAAALRRRGR